jgi:hypothetical protein
VKVRRPGLALLLPGFLAALLAAGATGRAVAQAVTPPLAGARHAA